MIQVLSLVPNPFGYSLFLSHADWGGGLVCETMIEVRDYDWGELAMFIPSTHFWKPLYARTFVDAKIDWQTQMQTMSRQTKEGMFSKAIYGNRFLLPWATSPADIESSISKMAVPLNTNQRFEATIRAVSLNLNMDTYLGYSRKLSTDGL